VEECEVRRGENHGYFENFFKNFIELEFMNRKEFNYISKCKLWDLEMVQMIICNIV
jgi:hypothetical protein